MRTLVADDHPIFREGLKKLLLGHPTLPIRLLGEASDGTALLQLLHHKEADLLILDLNMPGMNGLSGLRQTIAATSAPVVLMSGDAPAEDVRAALELGAKGFIPKTLSGRSLVSAVNLVADGETYAPPSVFERGPQERKPLLTVREKQVLSQLRHGSSNKEISRVLQITETTVKLHLRSISDKLTARNRTDIVIKAIEQGLL